MHIDKYKILGRLGRGGMGVVYKAEQPLTGRVVALKLCRPVEIMLDVAGADKVRELFLAEARTMGRVRHPNVAAILDAGEADVPGLGRMPFFTMEYFCNNLGVLMGEEYDAEKPSRLFPVPRALRYARQICEALRRLHYEGIVHRDVKPFNVMIADEDRAVLIDFGLSRLRGETPPAQDRPRGMVVGSPFYAAPEQEADPESADARSDLYAVGVTLFRMLTGRLPKEGGLERQPGRDKASEASEASAEPSARELRPELGPEWDEFFLRALARDPGGRFASAGRMLEALSGLERAFARERSEACVFHEEPGEAAKPALPRSAPLRVALKRAPEVFGLDALWRPRRYTANELEPRGETVLDRATGLFWQRGGSEYPLDFEQAAEYVAMLDESGYAGRSGWRLPTVEELCTLFVDRAVPGAFCFEPAFGADKARLWSADRKAFTAAWYVDADLGFVGWQDRTCFFYVRAVCGS
jgi:serine/threonine-protein kinase